MPAPRRPRHPEAKLTRFSVMDWVTLGVYALLMFALPLAFVTLVGDAADPVTEVPLTAEEEIGGFVMNAALYVVLLTLTLIALGREFWRSFRTFLWYPWAKFGAIPVAWFATIMVSGVLVTVFAALMGLDENELTQSQNQDSLDGMMTAVPWPLMVVVVVFMGPLVEEYIFRHLFIGKLSRYLNAWILVPISALAFMSLHFVGSEWPTLITGTPYFIMGLSFGIGYVLSGKSVAYAYVLHAFSNLIAVGVGYLLPPL